MSTLLNSLTIAGETMLLTRTVSGTSIHLTTTDASADARAAILDRPDGSRGAVPDELLDNRWSPRSLCGRTWAAMADGYDDHTGRRVDRPEAPNCRKCLAAIDKSFPTPTPDARIPVLADLAATAVNEHGTAEIVGVPGDQMNALRQRSPRRATTTLRVLHAHVHPRRAPCGQQPRDPSPHRTDRRPRHGRLRSRDHTKVDDTGWRFHWTTWSVS